MYDVIQLNHDRALFMMRAPDPFIDNSEYGKLPEDARGVRRRPQRLHLIALTKWLGSDIPSSEGARRIVLPPAGPPKAMIIH